MPKKLLIVESIKKARTIKAMLGAEFLVRATGGHILEMPADDIHVDLQNFSPTLYLIRGKGKKLKELKKAAGTAAGFTGLFGYVGGAVAANIVIGMVVDAAGWNAGFELIAAACILAMILISFTWRAEQRSSRH